MIHLLSFVAIMVVYALAEAGMDAADIGENKPVYHGEGWFRRAGVTAVLMLVMLAGGMDTDALPSCALMAYGAFTPVFWIGAEHPEKAPVGLRFGEQYVRWHLHRDVPRARRTDGYRRGAFGASPSAYTFTFNNSEHAYQALHPQPLREQAPR